MGYVWSWMDWATGEGNGVSVLTKWNVYRLGHEGFDLWSADLFFMWILQFGELVFIEEY